MCVCVCVCVCEEEKKQFFVYMFSIFSYYIYENIHVFVIAKLFLKSS